jgi:hypothetical protein
MRVLAEVGMSPTKCGAPSVQHLWRANSADVAKFRFVRES